MTALRFPIFACLLVKELLHLKNIVYIRTDIRQLFALLRNVLYICAKH